MNFQDTGGWPGPVAVACCRGRSLDLGTALRDNIAMRTLDAVWGEQREEILRLAHARGAYNVRVFGSVARGEAGEGSDLDLLVTWEPQRSLLDHAALALDLEDLLGVKVHIGTEAALHWFIRDRVLREAKPL